MLIKNETLIKVHTPKDTIIVPENVKIIQKCAFNSVSCQKVILPETLEVIEPMSFLFCSLQEINIPDDVKMYHDSFFECLRLNNIIISEEKFQEIKPYMHKYFGYCIPRVNGKKLV